MILPFSANSLLHSLNHPGFALLWTDGVAAAPIPALLAVGSPAHAFSIAPSKLDAILSSDSRSTSMVNWRIVRQ